MIIKDYDFSDELVVAFAYDSRSKKMTLTFSSFSKNGKHIEAPCDFTLQNWSIAKSRNHKSLQFDDLEANLGIPSLLLEVAQRGESVIIVTNTVDDRYVELDFSHATMSVTESENS